MEAYALARREGIGAQLVIAGPPDWQAQQLLAKIKKLQLEEMVRLPGYVAHNDLPAGAIVMEKRNGEEVHGERVCTAIQIA